MLAKVSIILPTMLEDRIGDRGPIQLEAETSFQAIILLVQKYPQLRDVLINDEGGFRGRMIQLFLNNVQLDRVHGEMGRSLVDGDVLALMAPVSGG